MDDPDRPDTPGKRRRKPEPPGRTEETSIERLQRSARGRRSLWPVQTWAPGPATKSNTTAETTHKTRSCTAMVVWRRTPIPRIMMKENTES